MRANAEEIFMARRKDKMPPCPDASGTTSQETEAPVSLSLPKRILLIAILCVIPFLLLGLLEVGLRVCGYGYPTGLFIPSANKQMLRLNPRFTWRFFPREISRPPLWQAFYKDKPENVYRVFVVGGSAAQGVPGPSIGMARILEVMLEEAYPETDFEVINAAITAINSHVVLPVVRNCVDQDPDLIIVFMGNNEVVGPFGPGSLGDQAVPSLESIRMRLRLQRTRCGQLMRSVSEAMQSDRPTEWRGMEMFAEEHVSYDDQDLQLVYDYFAQNLNDICEITARAGIPTLVCTVPVNLLDCPPFASEHRQGLTEQELTQWQEFYDAGVAAESSGQFTDAIRDYQEAAEIDPDYAELQYRLARCYLATNQSEASLAAFVLARDRDALRFRADTQINTTIRDIVSQRNNRETHLIDLQSYFADAAETPGLPGRDLFFEHVHMTFPGNYHAAAAVYEGAVPLLPQRVTHGQHPAPMSFTQVQQAMPVTAWDQATMLNEMLALAYRPPFTAQLDHEARLRSLLEDHSRFQSELRLGGDQEAEALYLAAMDTRPEDVDLQLRYALFLASQNRYAETEPILRHIIAQYPDHLAALKSLTCAVIAQEKYVEARQMLDELEDLSEDPAGTVYQVAWSASRFRRVEFALECAERAIELNPEMASAYELRGTCLMDQGNHSEGIQALREAIRLAPNSPTAQLSLAWALWSQGDRNAAITELRRAIELAPCLAEPRQLLGLIYAEQNRHDLADEQFELAIRLHPYNESGYLLYIESLLQRNNYAEAARLYQTAIENMPASTQMLQELAMLYRLAPEPVRNYEQAVIYSQRLVELTRRQDVMALTTLAVAYGDAGRFDDAVRTIDEAITLANTSGRTRLLSTLGTYRQAFIEGRPANNATPPSP